MFCTAWSSSSFARPSATTTTKPNQTKPLLKNQPTKGKGLGRYKHRDRHTQRKGDRQTDRQTERKKLGRKKEFRKKKKKGEKKVVDETTT
jgi:hypothetical protein